MAEQTIPLEGGWFVNQGGGIKTWSPPTASRPAIDAALGGGFLRQLGVSDGSSITPGRVSFFLTGDLTDAFEQTGTLQIDAASMSVLVALAGADSSAPYLFTPSNSDEVIALANALVAFGAEPGTLIIIRDFVPAAPSFTDNTGDDQSWTQNTAIASVTIPRSSGAPAPAYTQAGVPAGIDVTLPIEAQGVYRASRTRTYTDGSFTSATAWGSVNIIASPTGGVPGVPGVPGTPILSGQTANSLTLACTAPTTGGTPTLYRWRYSTNNNVTDVDPFITSTGPSVTIPGLNEDDNYWIDVRAENGEGESTYTDDLATTTTDIGTTTDTDNVYRRAASTPSAPPGGTTSENHTPSGWQRTEPDPIETADGSITGTPTAVGSGTITITATNSEGSDDWTVAYSVLGSMFYGSSRVSGFRYGSETPTAIYYGSIRVF